MGLVKQDNLLDALSATRERLLDWRLKGGHFTGELSSSALSTATAVTALAFFQQSQKSSIADLGEQLRQQIEAGLLWLIQQQRDDGGWGDTAQNYSNISTTMLVVSAFHAAGKNEQFSNRIDHANEYIKRAGGVAAIKARYGNDKTFAVPILANAAMAGLVPWSEVGVLPFEAACVPQRFYHLLNLPVVSYAIPALVAIGQAKFHFDPPRNPLTRWVRRRSIQRSLRVLENMQPQSGGYLEAIPLTSFVCMALIQCGRADHSVVENGIRFLLDSFRRIDEQTGTWPIDTNLATWVTTLSINALAQDDQYRFEKPDWERCLDWLLDCQYQTIHPFTGSPPGGWGWSDLTGSVPDADDTPGAMLALKVFYNSDSFQFAQTRMLTAAQKGADWLLRLQNRDGGWPTFCRGWGRLPFDRSGSDLTAHVIRSLDSWKEHLDAPQIGRAIERGFGYLAKHQQSDGSWLPLWFGNQDQVDDINPFYGTAKVLLAYHQTGQLHTNVAKNGLKWIRENQNRDGGWGGGTSIQFEVTKDSISSIEETALCTEVLLLDDSDQSQKAAAGGVHWLQQAVEKNRVSEYSPIGFYFAKLWYYEKMYPLIFATSALGTAYRIGSSAQIARERKLDSVH